MFCGHEGRRGRGKGREERGEKGGRKGRVRKGEMEGRVGEGREMASLAFVFD